MAEELQPKGMLISLLLHWQPDQPVQVLTVAVLLIQRSCDGFKLLVVDPSARRNLAGCPRGTPPLHA
jgi:hypothetical protein